ncbi:MAG: O-antigen ligase family protein [Atribacterota bacterium]
MLTESEKIYKNVLNTGIILLGIGIPFSVFLMGLSLGFLIISVILGIIIKKIKIHSTGLEIPLVIFLVLYLFTAVIAPTDNLKNIKNITDNYWSILFMYMVVFLFKEKQIKKFTKILGWSIIAASGYTILQSFAGLTLAVKFHMPDMTNALSYEIEKVTEIFGYPIFMGTGTLGHHLTFGGQMLMMLFFSMAVFKNKKYLVLPFTAFVLSFAYSAWFGFFAGVFLWLLIKENRKKYAFLFAGMFVLILFAVPGNFSKIKEKFKDRIKIWNTSFSMYQESPVVGIGAGNYRYKLKEDNGKKYDISGGATTHPHSVYLTILTDGGIVTFTAFILFWIIFFTRYSRSPPAEKYTRLHKFSVIAVVSVLFAGIFQNYVTDAENSVLLWTLMGIIVKTHKIKNETL